MQKRVLSSLQERLLQTTVQKIIHCQIRGRYWMKWRTYYKQTVQLYSIAQRFHTWYSLSQSLNVWMRFTRSKCWIRSVEMTTLAGIFQCWKYVCYCISFLFQQKTKTFISFFLVFF
jgi:sulfatase maturation enzyme AslB (radical SAM superfamily)